MNILKYDSSRNVYYAPSDLSIHAGVDLPGVGIILFREPNKVDQILCGRQLSHLFQFFQDPWIRAAHALFLTSATINGTPIERQGKLHPDRVGYSLGLYGEIDFGEAADAVQRAALESFRNPNAPRSVPLVPPNTLRGVGLEDFPLPANGYLLEKYAAPQRRHERLIAVCQTYAARVIADAFVSQVAQNLN